MSGVVGIDMLCGLIGGILAYVIQAWLLFVVVYRFHLTVYFYEPADRGAVAFCTVAAGVAVIGECLPLLRLKFRYAGLSGIVTAVLASAFWTCMVWRWLSPKL